MSSYDHAIDWVRRETESAHLPAAVLGIATAEGVQELVAFGASGERAASVGDHFPLFSVTKPIVAMTALRAVERGRLALTDPLTAAIPEFGAKRADTVELRHMLSHSSGIGDPPFDSATGRRADLLADGSEFAAGAAVRYSTLAFEGIAAMIEHANGSPWEQAVAELVADAGADGFTFDVDCEPHPIFGAADVGLDYDAVHPHHPGAGAFARAEDLLAIGRALLVNDGSLLHPATVAALQSSQTDGLPVFSPAPGRPGETWGLGFRLRQNSPGLLAGDGYGHSGWGGAEFWVYPEQGACFTLLTNVMEPARFGVNIDRLHNAVVAGTR
ncbi:CubicO group peptidase (beta-lactamase class C family) [Microterricola gilva]|uniref:CubicO group peptidase (Beta-lactamase class C family) n=1 Tax=Microterricola gilva TaxID=393267 RepID=A0A4Q8AQ29_9MICO|nr:serine hydrolase domain-containing protein [Microterricola gilva]RZU66810.1 CubicO group peptidase (beta-lactamase class C family) [Microterricola gilva]